MKIKLAKSEIIHFIGIGGIGMSGLALVMKRMGFKVQGSDINLNKNIERLKQNKVKVFIGHKKKHIKFSFILQPDIYQEFVFSFSISVMFETSD